MRTKIKLLLVIIFIYSCNSTEKEYYSNGNIKAEYNIQDGLLNGKFQEYYSNGKIKETHRYKLNKKVDSSIFHNENGVKSHIIYWSKEKKNEILNFNEQEEIISRGMIHGEDENFRIGKWDFIDFKKGVDSIVEYVNYKNKSYANQIWLKNSNGDTIPLKGNFYKLITTKDTISIDEVVKFQFFLYEPYLSYFDSEVSVVLPDKNEELAEDFSNLFNIKTSIFLNLEKDGIPHPELDDEMPKNRIVAFGLVFDKEGKKNIRGALIEKVMDSTSTNDSAIINERILFFNKEIFVTKRNKDTD